MTYTDNPKSILITKNINISSLLQLRTYTFSITQSANQVITVICNGVAHTSTFTATHGQTWTATIVSTNAAYNPGKLNISSGTISGASSVSATAATIKQYTVTITQPANGKITATYNGTNYTSTFKANHASTVKLTCTQNPGYKFNNWNGSFASNTNENLSINIKNNIVVSATIAAIPNTPDRRYDVPTENRQFTLTVPNDVYVIRAASSIEGWNVYVGASIYNVKSKKYWVKNTTSYGDIDIEKFIRVTPGKTYTLYMQYEGANGGSWVNRLATLKSGNAYNNKKIDYYDKDFQ